MGGEGKRWRGEGEEREREGGQYTRRTVVRRELERTRANSPEFGEVRRVRGSSAGILPEGAVKGRREEEVERGRGVEGERRRGEGEVKRRR